MTTARKYITLPNGRAVSLSTYVRAWRDLYAMPADKMVTGFDDWPATAGDVLERIRSAMHERINHRGARAAGLPTAWTFERTLQCGLQHDRRIVEDTLHHRTRYSGCNLLHTKYMQRRYPAIHNPPAE